MRNSITKIALHFGLILGSLLCTNSSIAQCFHDTVLACGTVTLSITPPPGGDATNSYNMTTVPYLPDPYSGTDAFTSLNYGDDNYSDSIGIGFNFCFYGSSYNVLAVSSNNYISFNVPTLAANFSLNGGYSSWELDDPIPDPNGEYVYDASGYPYPPLNTILGPWQDIDPGVPINGYDLITYQVLGCYPYRRFVVSYDSLPYFDCTNLYFKGQIVIFESTNVIEIRLQHKDECSSWSGWAPGAAVEGLHNTTGTAATVVPGRNYYNVWTANNETYRFTPVNPAPTVNWYQGMTLVGTGTSINVTPTASTVYTATITYACANTIAVDSFIVLYGDSLPTMGSTPSACSGNTGTAWAIPNSSNGPFTYVWTPSGQNGQTATNLGAGLYTVMVTNASGCVTLDTVTVPSSGGITLNGGVINLLCFGDNTGQAFVSVNGGTAPFTYAWTPSIQSGQTATNLGAGSFTCSVTDANGCLASIIELVSQPAVLNVITVPASPPACVAGSFGSDTAFASGGTGAYAYLWSPSGGNGTTAINLAAGNYTVVITDVNGCTASSISSITNGSALSLTQSLDDTICQGEHATMNIGIVGGNAPFTILWMPGAMNTTTVTVAPTITTTYNIVVTDVTGCIANATINIVVMPGPQLNFTGGPVAGCTPWTVQFFDNSTSIDPIILREWNFGDGYGVFDTLNPWHTYLTPGIYDVTLTLTTSTGCVVSITDSAMITAYPVPIAHFLIKPEQVTMLNSEVRFFNHTIGDYSTLFWNFGDNTTSTETNPFHTYPDTGTYWVTLIACNQYGCCDTAQGTVIVTPDNAFYIPSAFHPKSDGNNRNFQGYGVGITEYEMTIFDRWGEQIFFSNNLYNPWDGTLNGVDCPQGVYVYYIKVTNNFAVSKEYKGSVTLVR